MLIPVWTEGWIDSPNSYPGPNLSGPGFSATTQIDILAYWGPIFLGFGLQLQLLPTVAGPSANKRQTQTWKRKNQDCLDKINNTPDGKFYNFFSPLSMIPGTGPDWKGSVAEDVGGSAAKFTLFKFFQSAGKNWAGTSLWGDGWTCV